MKSSAASHPQGGEPEPFDPASPVVILTPERILLDANITSKKRLLEELAALLTGDDPRLNKDTIFQILFERERLGCTGIGSGIALPHGRVSDLAQPLGAVIRVRQALDMDAIDQQPVSFVFGLIVPAEADQKHLKILADLARMFSDASIREHLMRVPDATGMYDAIARWSSDG